MSLVAVLSVVGAVYRLYPTREVHSCIRVMPVIDMHGPSWKNRQRHEVLCRSLGDKILTAEFLNVTLSSFVKDPVGSRSYGTITAARLQRDLQIECLDESHFVVISIRRGSAIPRAQQQELTDAIAYSIALDPSFSAYVETFPGLRVVYSLSGSGRFVSE